MNDSSTGPLVIGLLFILRCLIPLGILFGISYLLQRLGLVDNNNAPEKKTGSYEDEGGQISGVPSTTPGKTSASVSSSNRKQGKKKATTPKTRSRNQ